MKDIIIVCAGSTAQEVYSILDVINREAVKNGREPEYNILGFIDDNPNSVLADYVDAPLIGNITDWHPRGSEVYALGNSNPKAKEKIVSILKPRGCHFETIIAPYARVKPFARIGEGCVITAFNINNGAVIGDYVNIQGSMIGGQTQIGDYSTTLGFANVAQAQLGKRVYVGSHAVVLNVPVEDDAFICVGSIVVSRVKQGTKVFGNPAKRVNW